MRNHLIKSFALGLLLVAETFSCWAQTTVKDKDQAYAKDQTVTYANSSKTVAYTNADNDIGYLGTKD